MVINDEDQEIYLDVGPEDDETRMGHDDAAESFSFESHVMGTPVITEWLAPLLRSLSFDVIVTLEMSNNVYWLADDDVVDLLWSMPGLRILVLRHMRVLDEVVKELSQPAMGLDGLRS